MMGRIIGGMLGSAIGRQKGNHGIAGAVIGAGTLFAARRLFPQRYAVLAATVAAGYLTKKWAERAEARKAAEEAHAMDAALGNAGVVDPYAGITNEPTDGETIGDALPPAIPLDANGRSAALH
ncbi:hypothetical protein [Sphingopyxis macrogoltabida]|uniref:Uncharacterized protein n=1 Tax=Sphingopyxis macrogoltabida TaxID=33050 RepID=A0AAC9ATW8_SPHMC|nr:hypothetical protein [Sphingopyxis macrogoltabida]ALJ11332.1 hypothetical protein LH19_00510 [Sphingopyxis macrogoltabida]AMU87529.1 hypothetical protein ATM17_00510 [Sphingopyxis macrogoltabida]